MDAFETLIALLLRREGYWTTTSLKVELTKEEKCQIGLPSSPRWELDVVGYKGSTNEILVVECKSYLNSQGVLFQDGVFEPPKRYKLFQGQALRECVLARLANQLVARGAVAPHPKVTLALAIGKLAGGSDETGLRAHFARQGWRLIDRAWIKAQLLHAADSAYENDIAHVVAKLLKASGGGKQQAT